MHPRSVIRGVRRFARRLVRWCFGRVEPSDSGPEASSLAPQAPGLTPADLCEPRPTSLDQARQAIADAMGLPLENVKFVPLRLVRCDCPNCQRARRVAAGYEVNPN